MSAAAPLVQEYDAHPRRPADGPRAARERLHSLHHEALHVCGLDRVPRMLELRDLWSALDAPVDGDACAAVAELAEACGDWPLLRAVAAHLAERGPLPRGVRLACAIAAWSMGDLDAALDHCEAQLLAAPYDSGADALHREIAAWAGHCQGFPFRGAPECFSDSIYVDLMGRHHWRDLRWHLDDADLVHLCDLPDLCEPGDWHLWFDWLVARNEQLPLVVVHPGFGVIGMVSLYLRDGAGFLYYWIGADFRGHGFATAAAGALLEVAARWWGLSECFAKVYAENRASIRTLERLGFEALGVTQSLPAHDALYYRLAAPGAPPPRHERIVSFTDPEGPLRFDFGMRFELPGGGTPAAAGAGTP